MEYNQIFYQQPFWGCADSNCVPGSVCFYHQRLVVDAMFSVWSYIIGAILFLLLAFQCTMIIGSLKIIDTADEYKAYFTEILDNAYEDWEQVPDDVAEMVIDKAIEECPLLEHYIGGGEFTGFSAKELPTAITEELRSFMKAYIVRRLLWCLGFTLVAGTLGIMTLNRQGNNYLSMNNWTKQKGSLTTNYSDDVF
ncbi:MAG: hypothetical protein IKC18_07500 [Bacteroidaceae bacterium]|nr:hypothetical protein [Bacteroidaceae bacterium]